MRAVLQEFIHRFSSSKKVLLLLLIVILAIPITVIVSRKPQNIKQRADVFPAILIDPRLGVTHVAGKYPNLGKQFLYQGSIEAKNLGFQTIELYFSREICSRNGEHPQGLYQSLDFCPLPPNLTTLAQNQEFKKVFALPFKTFFLTVDSLDPQAASYLTIGGNTIEEQKLFTATEKQKLYDDVKELTLYLSDTYKGTGKTFILQTPNEMDWKMIPQSKHAWEKIQGSIVYGSNEIPSAIAVQNATDYWNAVQNAVDDAKAENPPSEMRIFHACEVNFGGKSMLKRANNTSEVTAINNVVPNTHCDLYGYSGYDTILADYIENGVRKYDIIESYQSDHRTLFQDALEYFATKAPPSRDFGRNNIYIAESGAPENVMPGASAEERRQQSDTILQIILRQTFDYNLPYFLYWELYDNTCYDQEKRETSFAKCQGFWIKKPSGETASAYRVLSTYRVEAEAPTLTPTTPPIIALLSPTATPVATCQTNCGACAKPNTCGITTYDTCIDNRGQLGTDLCLDNPNGAFRCYASENPRCESGPGFDYSCSTCFADAPTPTITPTLTPTVTPIPAPTLTTAPVPTNTPTPTPTKIPGNIKVSLALTLSGIGNGIGANLDPKTKTRQVTICLYAADADINDDPNCNNALVKTTGTVTFDTATKRFTQQSFDLGQIPDGNYQIVAKTDKYLRKRWPTFITLRSETTTPLANLTLLTGDINDDNILDVQDYNAYRDCFYKNLNNLSCRQQDWADLNDDGKLDTTVDFSDIKLLLQNFSVREGD